MFGVGGGEMMVIALVALIAVGPEQLPSVMRKFGRYLAQFRTMADGVRGEFMAGLDEMDPAKWTGDGSDEKPIVPRGYAENALKSSAAPGEKPVSAPGPKMAQPETVSEAFSPGPDTTGGVNGDETSLGAALKEPEAAPTDVESDQSAS